MPVLDKLTRFVEIQIFHSVTEVAEIIFFAERHFCHFIM